MLAQALEDGQNRCVSTTNPAGASSIVPDHHVIFKDIDRPDPEALSVLEGAGVASVHEAIGRRGYVGPSVICRLPGARVAGAAVTVLSHPGDNLMIHAAITVSKPGDIIVVAHTSPSAHGEFGDLLATSMQAHGIRAFVTDAGIRDIADVRALGFPVWSRHVSCHGTLKAAPGSVNVPIPIGDAIVNPGDVVCADDDGVVVVPRHEARWAADQVTRRIEHEAILREAIERGETTLDLYGLRPQLARLGVEIVDRREAR